MNSPQAWARRLVPLLVLPLLLLLPLEQALAQIRLRCDAVSALGGRSSSASHNLLAIAGQPHPIETSSSAAHILRPGFIPCLLPPSTGECRVLARVDCPPEILEGSQFTAVVFIDMGACPSPDNLLGSFSSRLNWDATLLRFASHSGILAGFTGVVNTANANTGMLEFNGTNPAGAGGDIRLLEITFDVVGTNGANGILDLNFSALAAALSFTNLLPNLSITDCPFRIIQSACMRCGDVSDDNAVNSTDALIVLSFDAGITLPQPILDKINAGCGDVNSDNATNSTDALIILSYDAGITVPFPVGNPGGCGGVAVTRNEKPGAKIEERKAKNE